MGLDFTITVGNLLTAFGFGVAALGAYFFQRYRIDSIEARLTAKEEKDALREAQQAVQHAEAFAVARKARDDIAAFKLDVVQNFVQHASLKEVELRLISEMKNLTAEITALRHDLVDLLKERKDR